MTDQYPHTTILASGLARTQRQLKAGRKSAAEDDRKPVQSAGLVVAESPAGLGEAVLKAIG